MSTCFLDGIQIGDDGRNAYLSPELLASVREAEIARRERGRLALDRVLDEIASVGRRGAIAAVKRRARAFERRPIQLDAIPGLAAWSSPKCIIATCNMLLASGPVPRNVGFGGETPLVNLRAARLYARWSRRFDSKEDTRFTAVASGGMVVEEAA